MQLAQKPEPTADEMDETVQGRGTPYASDAQEFRDNVAEAIDEAEHGAMVGALLKQALLGRSLARRALCGARRVTCVGCCCRAQAHAQ